MKAKVTKEFTGRPDSEALARIVAVDEIITGDLAEVAVRDKLAKKVADDDAAPAEAAKPEAK